MPSSSESIANLAGALAKAQLALVNPEKTMTATIRDGRAGGEGAGAARSFRYAPLSAGLEIVRSTLGQHEIAVMQTTAIDEGRTTVVLKTMLAHSSGEWIASDWPVCAVADVASPQRMGAALTYARRYALFTLVGIAGEDDLDAPDLDHVPETTSLVPSAEPRLHPGNGAGWGRAGDTAGYRSTRNRPARPPQPAPLSVEASRARGGSLIAELAGLASAEDAISWAHRILPEKNRLTAEDARLLEQAYAARMQELEQIEALSLEAVQARSADGAVAFESAPALDPLQPQAETEALSAQDQVEHGAEPPASDQAPKQEHPAPEQTVTTATGLPSGEGPEGKGEGSSQPSLPQRIPTKPPSLYKPVRRRDGEHLRFVATQPCLICARTPSDAHHLRFAQVRALGRKVSDEFTVPLCRTHHREVHRTSKEADWWTKLGLSPLEVARKLWRQSHGDRIG